MGFFDDEYEEEYEERDLEDESEEELEEEEGLRELEVDKDGIPLHPRYDEDEDAGY